jgi:hypothetical protein
MFRTAFASLAAPRRALQLAAGAGSLACVGAALLAVPAQGQQQVAIGATATVVNQVAGSEGNRTLKVGDRVFANETITTGPNSRSQLLFSDETVLTVGPDSEVKLDSFVYNPNRTGSKAALSATKGVFRFVSGNMPSNSYEIKTPSGTIGVRGTIFDGMVDPDGSVTIQLVEGAVQFTGLTGGTFRITAAGQVLTVRPSGVVNITGQLSARQRDKLAAIRDFVVARDNVTGDTVERDNALRDVVRTKTTKVRKNPGLPPGDGGQGGGGGDSGN